MNFTLEFVHLIIYSEYIYVLNECLGLFRVHVWDHFRLISRITWIESDPRRRRSKSALESKVQIRTLRGAGADLQWKP